jgi:predicted ATPase
MHWPPIVLWHLGYPEQARQQTQAALHASQNSDILLQAVYLYFATQLHQLRRDRQMTQQLADQLVDLATAQALPLQIALGTLLQGWALCQYGQVTEGLRRMQEGLAGYRATGARAWCSLYEAMLAEGYYQVGAGEAGLRSITRALQEVDISEERCWEAELYRLKGLLLQSVRGDNQTEVETCFHQALDIARHQQAKSLELRAAMSLARLWQRQDKRQDAYDLLAPVYNWFTEGFDTADLQEARVLLDELA